MAKIKTMRMSGRRFGWKVGISQIAVKEYFDVAEKLQRVLVKQEGIRETCQHDGTNQRYPADYDAVLRKIDRLSKRLRAVESRTWTPMESFIVDRPSEDEVNLETFVKGHILARIEESTNDGGGIQERAESAGKAVEQGRAHAG